jgi:hemolysin activation/secretion protein
VVGELKVRPEHVYGRPDWDLVLKAFVDAARVHIEDADQPGDQGRNETLLAVGLGAELHLLRYLSARVDLGWPQRKLEGEDVDRPEIHTAITLRF